MDDDERRHSEEIAAAMNRRCGHASMLATPSPSRKWQPVVEVSWATEFAEAVRHKWGWIITDIRSNDKDPPDCLGMAGGREVGIELVELVNQQILETNAKSQGTGASTCIEAFLKAQWTKETFEERIAEVLDKKDRKYARNGHFIDILVVITDENWLDWKDAEAWLAQIQDLSRPSFSCAFLLFTYDPRYPDHLPVLKLFGDIGPK